MTATIRMCLIQIILIKEREHSPSRLNQFCDLTLRVRDLLCVGMRSSILTNYLYDIIFRPIKLLLLSKGGATGLKVGDNKFASKARKKFSVDPTFGIAN